MKKAIEEQEETINEIKKDIKPIPDLMSRVTELEKRMQTNNTFAKIVAIPKAAEKENNESTVEAEKEKSVKMPNSNKEVLDIARKIIGLYPIDPEDVSKHIDADDIDEKSAMMKAANEFLEKELAFRKEEIADMKISELNRPRKIGANTVYITLKDVHTAIQIF